MPYGRNNLFFSLVVDAIPSWFLRGSLRYKHESDDDNSKSM